MNFYYNKNKDISYNNIKNDKVISNNFRNFNKYDYNINLGDFEEKLFDRQIEEILSLKSHKNKMNKIAFNDLKDIKKNLFFNISKIIDEYIVYLKNNNKTTLVNLELINKIYNFNTKEYPKNNDYTEMKDHDKKFIISLFDFYYEYKNFIYQKNLDDLDKIKNKNFNYQKECFILTISMLILILILIYQINKNNKI